MEEELIMKTISVCIGSACHVYGSYDVVSAFNRIIDERDLKGQIELVGSFCMGNCTLGVSVKCDDIAYFVSKNNGEGIFEKIMEEK